MRRTVDAQGKAARDGKTRCRQLLDQPHRVVERATTRPAGPHDGDLGAGKERRVSPVIEGGRGILEGPEGFRPGGRCRREQGGASAFAREPMRFNARVRNGAARRCENSRLHTCREFASHQASPGHGPDPGGKAQPYPVSVIDHCGTVPSETARKYGKALCAA